MAGQRNEEAAQKIHNELGALIWQFQQLQGLHAASENFIRGTDAAAFASVLASAAHGGQRSEQDLFIVRAVLQVCLLDY